MRSEVKRRLLVAFIFWFTPLALHADAPAVRSIPTQLGFGQAVTKLEEAVAANQMLLLAKASASAGAAARGITIPGNAVLEVFRNDYAVRMLRGSIAAGIEAPLRLYVTEGADGRAVVSYRLPSQVFAPYGGGDLAEMARELDLVFAKIVKDATGQ